jgi:hypothetical protein
MEKSLPTVDLVLFLLVTFAVLATLIVLIAQSYWPKKPQAFRMVATTHPEDRDEMDNDPMIQDAVRRAFESGNIVIGNRQDDGSWKTEEIKPEE